MILVFLIFHYRAFSFLCSMYPNHEKLIKDLDKAIDDLVVVLPEYQCLTSIPGIGPV